MRCLECSADLLDGFSECFSCGAPLHPVQQRANSPYHAEVRRETTSALVSSSSSANHLGSPLYDKSSRRHHQRQQQQQQQQQQHQPGDFSATSSSPPTTSSLSLTSPEKTRWSKYGSTDYASGVGTGATVWSPEADQFPWRKERAFVVAAPAPAAAATATTTSSNSKNISSRMILAPRQHSDDDDGAAALPYSSPAAARRNAKATAARIAELEQELAERKSWGMTLVPNTPSSSNPILNESVNAVLLDSADKFLQRTQQKQQQQQQQKQEVAGAEEAASAKKQAPAVQQPDPNKRSSNDDDNNNKIQQHATPTHEDTSSSSSSWPFSAHAAAFMVDAYARNIHENMLEHRDDLLRLLGRSMRERVAFGKASEEIREAETFAAKAEAIRSVETSKVMQENADLRFELEEARAEVERQKEITASVAKELADVRAQHETTMLAYQSIGSPMNQQSVVGE